MQIIKKRGEYECQKTKADFYREYDLIECRNYASKKPPAAHQEEAIIKLKMV